MNYTLFGLFSCFSEGAKESRDFPLVSVIEMTKRMPKQQLIARNKRHPCNLMATSKIGENLSTKNALVLIHNE